MKLTKLSSKWPIVYKRACEKIFIGNSVPAIPFGIDFIFFYAYSFLF